MWKNNTDDDTKYQNSETSIILFHKQWMGGHFETLIKRHYWHYHHLLFFYKLHICFVFIFLSICWCSGLNFQKIDQIFSEKFQICTDLSKFEKLKPLLIYLFVISCCLKPTLIISSRLEINTNEDFTCVN